MPSDLLHPAAVLEAAAAAKYYEEQEPGLGARFRTSLYRTVGMVSAVPEAWPTYRAVRTQELVRHLQVKPFQERVLYVVRDRVWIVAVAHARRKPGYWADRLLDGR